MSETTIVENTVNATQLRTSAAQTKVHGEQPEPHTANEPQLLLPANLAALAKLTNKDGSGRHSATTGVKLDRIPDPYGTTQPWYRAIVTDCRRLAIVDGPSDFPSEYPPVAGIMSAPNGATSAIISAQDWTGAFKGIPKRSSKPILRLSSPNVSAFRKLFSTHTDVRIILLWPIPGKRRQLETPYAFAPSAT